MKVPLVDLVAQYNSIKDEIDEAVLGVIRKGQFIGGDEVSLLEAEIAKYSGSAHAIGVASGTDALRLSLLAHGISQEDEVITTPFTFIATAETISQCGATPVFCDINMETYNINPMVIEDKITGRTKAILPVHLYGQPADMDTILDIARRHKLIVIEDCAQAFGAKYKGSRVGSLGNTGCFSFFPSKTLGAYGDGGMVVTNDADVADKIRMLRNHGGKDKYHSSLHGFNSRLDAVQATVLRVKLRHVDEWISARNEKAAEYNRSLSGLDCITAPVLQSGSAISYYTVRVSRNLGRDNLARFLESKDVSCAVYYPVALHFQEVYECLGYRTRDLPCSEQASEEVLSLPLYPEIEDKQVEWVCNGIKEFCGK